MELQNVRHERFVRGIVAGLVPRMAYTAAGYRGNVRTTESAANRLLSKVDIKSRIAELQREAAREAVLDRAEVLRRLNEFSQHAERESDRIKATELLGKALGIFVDRVDLRVLRDENVRSLAEKMGVTYDEAAQAVAEAEALLRQ